MYIVSKPLREAVVLENGGVVCLCVRVCLLFLFLFLSPVHCGALYMYKRLVMYMYIGTCICMCMYMILPLLPPVCAVPAGHFRQPECTALQTP